MAKNFDVKDICVVEQERLQNIKKTKKTKIKHQKVRSYLMFKDSSRMVSISGRRKKIENNLDLRIEKSIEKTAYFYCNSCKETSEINNWQIIHKKESSYEDTIAVINSVANGYSSRKETIRIAFSKENLNKLKEGQTVLVEKLHLNEASTFEEVYLNIHSDKIEDIKTIICPICGKEHYRDDIVVIDTHARKITRSSNISNKSTKDRNIVIYYLTYDALYHENGNVKISSSKDLAISVFDGKVSIKNCNMGCKSGKWSYKTYTHYVRVMGEFLLQKKDSENFKKFVEILYDLALKRYKYIDISLEEIIKDCFYDESETQIKQRCLIYIAFLSKIMNGQIISFKNFEKFTQNYKNYKKVKHKTNNEPVELGSNPEPPTFLYDKKMFGCFKPNSDTSFEENIFKSFKVKGSRLRMFLSENMESIYIYKLLFDLLDGNTDLIHNNISLIKTGNGYNNLIRELNYELFTSKEFKIFLKTFKSVSKEKKLNFTNSLKIYHHGIKDICRNIKILNDFYSKKGINFMEVIDKNIFNDSKTLHDELTTEAIKIQDSVEFEYSEETINFFDFENEEYKLSIAKSVGELKLIGNKMNICVGSYGHSVTSGRCKILYVTEKETNKYASCIELIGKEIVQFKLFANNRPSRDSEIYKFVNNFANKKELKIERL